IAEVLRMVRELERIDPQLLQVVPMHGYRREMLYADTGLPWVLPSPNMPTLETAQVYPGGCLLEATNLSEGRGTTRPFELWGAPFVDGARLAQELCIAGATLRPLWFQPTFHKFAGSPCGGVQVHVRELETFQPYACYLRLIAWAAAASKAFAFRTETYEYVSDRPAMDLLTGGPEFREAVQRGAVDEALLAWLCDPGDFAQRRQAWLLY
ncbi:MAG TPA: exo-beta-N-acetylmuramidase NamZ domain-containing protein, partial [Polyangiales bacterium]